MIPSEDFDGGDRQHFEKHNAKPDDLFLLRVEIMTVKTKIKQNTDPTVDFASSNKFFPNDLSSKF